MILDDATSLVDIHNHLVPGVDDGARHLPGVLNAVERMGKVGIRRILTTPHLQGNLTVHPERLEERLDEVTRAWKSASEAIAKAFPEVEYKRGHEVLIDIPEPDLSDPRVRMADTSFVLVEWPRLHVPPGTTRVIRWIRDQGYRPIIAHPERYANMLNTPALPAAWQDAGARLQVNYGSLVGRYGADAQAVAFRILEEGLADYLASDFHGQSAMSIYRTEAWEVLAERQAFDALDMLCRTNPSRLLDGQEPLAVPCVGAAPRLLARLRSMIVRRRAGPGERSR